MSTLTLPTYIHQRFDLRTWIIVACILLVPTLLAANAQEAMVKFGVTLCLLFSFRVMDDVFSSWQEKLEGLSRVYHDRAFQRRILLSSEIVFLAGFGFFSSHKLLYVSGIFIIHALYLGLYRFPLVKWISLLKYPFIIYLLAPTISYSTHVYALYVFAIFIVRELIEEKVYVKEWIWLVPVAMTMILIPESISLMSMQVALSCLIIFGLRVNYNLKFLMLNFTTVFYLIGSV